MEADLEEGEILDSDEEETAQVPDGGTSDAVVVVCLDKEAGDASKVPQPTALPPSYSNLAYRNTQSHHHDDSDNTDTSDEDTDLWQCKKAKYLSKPRIQNMDLTHEITSPPRGAKPQTNDTDEDLMESPQKKRKMKVNNIWGSVITEQTITQSFKTGANVDKNEECTEERDVESYDYTKARDDDRPNLPEVRPIHVRESNDPFENVLDTIEELYDGDTKKSENRKRKRHVKDRIGRQERRDVKERLGVKDSSDVAVTNKLDVTEEDPEEKVIKAILDMLEEPNGDLFGKIVGVIGKTLALKYAHLTENVESAGGMLTFDGGRRRTPGGVYIQLLKNGKDITKEQTKEIFAEEEMKYQRERRKMKKARRRRSNHVRNMLPQSKYASHKSNHDGKPREMETDRRHREVEMGNGKRNAGNGNSSEDHSGDEVEGPLDIALEIEAVKQKQAEAKMMDDSDNSLNVSDVDIELGECETMD